MSPALVKQKRERIKEKLKRLKQKAKSSPEIEELLDLFEDIIEYDDARDETLQISHIKPITERLNRQEEKTKEIEISLRQLIEMVKEEMHMGFEAMNARLEALQREMDKRFEAMDKRFEAMDKRFEALREEMNARFEAMDKRFELLKEGQNRLWTFIMWWVPFWIGIYTAILKLLIFK